MKSTKKQRYTSSDITLIIPTKDRPHIIENLLESIVNQTVSCRKIIIVASGGSIENVIKRFSKKIQIDYYECDTPGQIHQRNFGIRHLDEETRLVGILDDDIVLSPDAIEKIADFWNTVETETAGVGFNVINEPSHQPSVLKLLLGITSREPGRVHRSGTKTSIGSVDKTLRTEWLNGGATIWRRKILHEITHKEINARWAIFEDLIFSYPIGKMFPLYICPDAKVRHEHVVDQFIEGNIYIRRGQTMSLWQLYFVLQNINLSVPSCLWAIFLTSLASIAQGIFVVSKREKIYVGAGMLIGLFIGIRQLVSVGTFAEKLSSR